MKGFILLTVFGYLFSAGTSLYIKKDSKLTDVFNRRNFDPKSSPLVILGVWPASVFGIGDQTSHEEGIVHTSADGESEKPQLVVDYYPADVFGDDSTTNDDENISNDNGNDNGLQTESPSDSETATPDISNTDSSNPDNSNSDTTMDDDPTLVIDSWPQDLIDNVENMTKELEELAANSRRKRDVSCGNAGVLRIKAYYDANFSARFGAGAETRIQAIFYLVQAFLELNSLSVNVNGQTIDSFRLKLVDIIHLPDTTTQASQDGLRQFSSRIANGETADKDHYMLFSSQNDQGGVVGVAWLSSLCHQSKYVRTSLVEYFRNNAMTAIIAVHELAHTLGAYHDFGNDGPGDNRFDSIGNLCTGIGGLMDYQSSRDKWSPCSNEDIGAYLRNLNQLCFPLESSCPTTTIATTTEATEDEDPVCSCEKYKGRRSVSCCRKSNAAGFCCAGCKC